ncbi:hypothetical protein OUZ56_017315 [Daphnia magna]|uniref:Uncharacterized protein n=1 Tax=Daphnia magna TaxID=35525 RepID=A0ABR0ASN4_9CRUS|nr:hypothetical protein OUZ56_017315 [Daphnia magna]
MAAPTRNSSKQKEDQEIESRDIPLVTSPKVLADDEVTVTEHLTADGAMVPCFNRNVTFSESAWTTVTDLDLGPAGTAIAYLQQKILQQQAVADKWKQQGSRHQKIATKRIFSKSNHQLSNNFLAFQHSKT